MSEVYIIGVGSTVFGRWPERSFRDLASEAIGGALADAGSDAVSAAIEQISFANCAMDAWGQTNVRGQVCLDPLMRDGTLPAGVPVVNVEGGCASGSAAFHAAFKDVRSGEAEASLAVGVEKTIFADDPMRSFKLFAGGIDQLHPKEWAGFYRAAGEQSGVGFAPHPQRIVFLDVHAMQARHHMAQHGSTAEQLAAVASKNRDNGALNARAQRRRPMAAEAILADRPVCDPLTRSMCAPISDGAAAVLLVSESLLAKLPAAQQARAVRVRASVLSGATWRELGEPSVVARAAQRAYARAGVSPEDIDIAEVHDATSFCEIAAMEMLGFCPPGAGGDYASSGETSRTGRRPVNASGGLIARGHPLAATGLAMIEELVCQLRGEAGARQVARQPTIALQQNAGGMVGFDEALCSVAILERRSAPAQ